MLTMNARQKLMASDQIMTNCRRIMTLLRSPPPEKTTSGKMKSNLWKKEPRKTTRQELQTSLNSMESWTQKIMPGRTKSSLWTAGQRVKMIPARKKLKILRTLLNLKMMAEKLTLLLLMPVLTLRLLQETEKTRLSMTESAKRSLTAKRPFQIFRQDLTHKMMRELETLTISRPKCSKKMHS